VSLVLVSAVRSDVGHVREGNEDSAFAGPRLLAVADGMGGHAAGEVASKVAIHSLMPLDDDAPGADILGALRDALEDANATLRDMVAADRALEGMGTTVTALLSSGRRLGLVHIGDSRAYLLRAGELARITRDHTYVQELLDAGQISEEDIATHPQRSLILRALNGEQVIDPELRVREAVAGDRYLLCSDGLTGVVSDTTLKEVLRDTPAPADAVDRLVELALKGGGPDNISVIVADVVEHGPESAPQVAGAAAEAAGRPSATARLSAAGRAALTRARRVGPAVAEPAGSAAAPDASGGRAADPPRSGHGRRLALLRPVVVVPIVLVVLLLATAVGTAAYVRTQWYVGVDRGQVAVFRGVPGSVIGLSLSSVQRHLGAVDDVVEADRRRLEGGITASSRTDAVAIVATLQRRPAPAAPTTPAPTDPAPATPTPAPTPAPTP